jgi:uncharacterized membrane protein YcaP (DUF421 family)
MNNIYALLGHGEELTPSQMALRALFFFILTLVLIRLGGVRIFGERSSFDTIIMIVMGSVIARGVVGASPILSVIAAATAMIVLHRLLSWLSYKNNFIETLIKSKRTPIYRNGRILSGNLERTGLSKQDLMESLRLETKQSSLEKVKTAYLETDGRISFIMKNETE